MQRFIAVFCVTLFFLALTPATTLAQAEDDECDIDLTRVLEMLAEAQEAAESSDSSDALDIINDARENLTDIVNKCEVDDPCVGNVDLCAEISGLTVSVDGMEDPLDIDPGDLLELAEGDSFRLDSVAFDVSDVNLEVIREAHGDLSFVYAIAYPVIADIEHDEIPQFTLRGQAIIPISSGDHVLTARDGDEWEVDADWDYILVLLMHEDPTAPRGESVIGRTVINLRVD